MRPPRLSPAVGWGARSGPGSVDRKRRSPIRIGVRSVEPSAWVMTTRLRRFGLDRLDAPDSLKDRAGVPRAAQRGGIDVGQRAGGRDVEADPSSSTSKAWLAITAFTLNSFRRLALEVRSDVYE